MLVVFVHASLNQKKKTLGKWKVIQDSHSNMHFVESTKATVRGFQL